QLELANYYASSQNFTMADQHLELARELSPNSPAIIVAQGNLYFMRGERDRAIATWNTLIDKRRAGLLQHTSYFNAMVSHNLTTQALPAIERFLTRTLSRLPWSDLQPFVRQVAQAGGNNISIAQATAEMFYHVLRDNPGDLQLGAMLLKEDLILPFDSRVLVYRVMLERYNDALLATSQGGVYRDESENGSVANRLDNHER